MVTKKSQSGAVANPTDAGKQYSTRSGAASSGSFDPNAWVGSRFKVGKTPEEIRAAAEGILANKSFFGSVGQESPVSWAQTALSHLDSYDSRMSGASSKVNTRGEDLADRDLSRAYSWITGGAQANAANRFLSSYERSRSKTSASLANEASNVANAPGRDASRIDAMSSAASRLGLNPEQIKSQVTTLPSGDVIPTADLTRGQRMNSAAERQAAIERAAGIATNVAGGSQAPAGMTTSDQAQTVPGKKLGPTEYASLRKQFGVSEANFDQYFTRDASGNIYLKEGVNAPASTADFKVDVPDTLSTDTISEMTKAPVTGTEFDSMLADLKAKQDEILAYSVPGSDEQTTKAQINDIKAQVEKTLTELSMGLNNVEDQPIAMQFIAGQQASIQRSADAKLQNLSRIETNLLNELGLEQDARKVKATVAETQLGYLTANMDAAFKVRQMLQQEEDSVFNRAMALKKDAQGTFAMLLDSMKGMDESDMTPEQQKQLQDLASSSGIPYSLVTSGLSNVKKQMMESLVKKSSGGGSGGNGNYAAAIVMPEAVKSPSFEEYLAQKEDEAGQSFTQARRDELRKEYDAANQETKPINYADQFESVVINLGSVSAQTQARKYFQSLASANDTAGMDSYLNRLAMEGLTGKSKTDYDSMGTLSSGTNGALSSIEAFSATNPGVYKTALESGKPFLNASKDQRWVDFTSKVEAAQAGYINSVYGANLTGGELERANRYVIDFKSDDINTIKTKLTNMRNLANNVRSRLLGEQRGDFSSTSGQTDAKPSLDSFVTNLDQYLR